MHTIKSLLLERCRLSLPLLFVLVFPLKFFAQETTGKITKTNGFYALVLTKKGKPEETHSVTRYYDINSSGKNVPDNSGVWMEKKSDGSGVLYVFGDNSSSITATEMSAQMITQMELVSRAMEKQSGKTMPQQDSASMVEHLKKMQSSSQAKNSTTSNEDVLTDFPNVDSRKWRNYLQQKDNSLVKAPQGMYRTEVQFIVDKEGNLSNFKTTSVTPDGCPNCGPKAIELLKAGPKWNPVTKNGEKITAQGKIVIAFSGTGEN